MYDQGFTVQKVYVVSGDTPVFQGLSCRDSSSLGLGLLASGELHLLTEGTRLLVHPRRPSDRHLRTRLGVPAAKTDYGRLSPDPF